MSAAPDTATLAQNVLGLLEMDRIEENLYLAQCDPNRKDRVFGGQVLAQALLAATHTVEDLNAHSMHAYFIKAGSSDLPILYEVERIRDGRSFCTRRVVAVQDGSAIFNMDVSFQIEEPGFDHAHPMPNVPLPEELTDDYLLAGEMAKDPRVSKAAQRPRPFDMRSVFTYGSEGWAQNRYYNPCWLRFPEPITDRLRTRALLAYASDMALVSTATLPHQEDLARTELQMASLDHALWIHRDFVLDDWILFQKKTTVGEGARGLVHGDFFTRDGHLIASVSQEGLMRPVNK